MFKRTMLIVALAAAPVAAQQQPHGREQPRQQMQSHAGTRAAPTTSGSELMAPEATQVLRRMSDYLAGLRSFQVETVATDEVVLQSGQKVEYLTQSRTMVQRPNHVRSERVGPIADVVFRYDGQNFSVFGNRSGFYAIAAAPPTLDAAVDAARELYGLELPGADLLNSRPYETLTEGMTSAQNLGLEPIDGVNCHHLALRGNDVDLQLWIQDGDQPLPRRYVITSKMVRGEPEFTLQLSHWEPNAPIADDAFMFRPPPGATRINFLTRPATSAHTTEGR
jgi:hypothetical protein